MSLIDARGHLWSTDFLPEFRLGLENLRAHKLRSMLTMLGMIFGVAAVLAMLSIGAGAQQQVMAFIEDLGVRNLIVEARETTEWQAFQKVRQQSPGLSFHDIRAMQATVPGLDILSPRKRFTPTQVVPKPQGELPTVYGVERIYREIAGLRITSGRFFSDDEAAHAAAVSTAAWYARSAPASSKPIRCACSGPSASRTSSASRSTGTPSG